MRLNLNKGDGGWPHAAHPPAQDHSANIYLHPGKK